jgi:hypothetical protein
MGGWLSLLDPRPAYCNDPGRKCQPYSWCCHVEECVVVSLPQRMFCLDDHNLSLDRPKYNIIPAWLPTDNWLILRIYHYSTAILSPTADNRQNNYYIGYVPVGKGHKRGNSDCKVAESTVVVGICKRMNLHTAGNRSSWIVQVLVLAWRYDNGVGHQVVSIGILLYCKIHLYNICCSFAITILNFR